MEEKTHWKSLTNPNYLGGYSIPQGQDIIVTIDKVQREEIVGTNGKKEFEVVAHLKNGVLPFILNKCYAMTGVSETLDEVIKAWNRRADNAQS